MRGSPRSPAPAGFFVAGCFSAWFTVMMVVCLLMIDGGDSAWETLAARGAAALLAALSAVTTEALWWARRWAYRASLALAATYGVVVLIAGIVTGPDNGLPVALTVLFFSACVVVPLLAYIHARMQRLPGVAPVLAAASSRRVPAPQRP